MVSAEKKSILLTFDVEDWFQVENFKQSIPRETWSSCELRVEKNLHAILDLLDRTPAKPKATFFILGWIARKIPHMILEIGNRGHEVASHGDQHQLLTRLGHDDIEQDLDRAKKTLEDMTGQPVSGYRAPNFAIDNQILKLIEKVGYLYDSSFNNFSMHGRYGTIDLPDKSGAGICYKISETFYEVPVSNLKLSQSRVVPLGGGGYFRLFPFFLFKLGIKQVLKRSDAFVFYSHPWEFDPSQPRVENASAQFKFRHYINLDKTSEKLNALINAFNGVKFIPVKAYLTSKQKL